MLARIHRRSAHRSVRGFTLVELLVVIAIIGVLVALLLPAVQAAREAARRMNCQSNMRNLALAVLNFENATGALPAGTMAEKAGRNGTDFFPYEGPQFSWIVRTLPYFEMQSLYQQFDFKGTATQPASILTQNVQASPQSAQPSVLLCPSDGAQGRQYIDAALTKGPDGAVRSFGKGNYVAYAGPEHLNATKVFSGAINEGGQELRKVSDGAANTIMLSEVRTRDHTEDQRGAWAIAWAGSSLICLDLHSENLGPDSSWLSSNRPDIPYVPGTSRGMPTRANPPNNGLGQFNMDQLRKCPDSVGSDIERMPCHTNDIWGTAAPRSNHPGGVNIAFVDGSVHWLVDEIDVPTLGALICVNDGLTAQLP